MGEDRKSESSLFDRFKELYALIKEEWAFYGKDWSQPGFRAMVVYRFGVWRSKLRWRAIRAPLWLVYKALHRYVRNHYGIEIPFKSKIGRRFRIRHQHGITIHDRAVVGDDCMIRHGVTIGGLNDPERGYPVLGDRVEVGVGAVIVGGIKVGDDVKIGPNTVVMMDVPSGARVFGNPARVINAPTEHKDEKDEGGEPEVGRSQTGEPVREN